MNCLIVVVVFIKDVVSYLQRCAYKLRNASTCNALRHVSHDQFVCRECCSFEIISLNKNDSMLIVTFISTLFPRLQIGLILIMLGFFYE